MPTKSGASSSSMHTATSLGSSWMSSSPSRQSPSRQSPLRNGVRSPGQDRGRRSTMEKDLYDSPSRQMVLEFSQMLIKSDKEFNDRLDLAAAENAKVHLEQLAKAALEHERIREGAKRECQRIILEKELQVLRLEEEQKREKERLELEKARHNAEIRRRELEAKHREEQDARQAAEHQQKIQEAEARLRAQKHQEEAVRRRQLEQSEADRKAHEAAAAAAKAQSQPPQSTPQVAQPPSGSTVPATTVVPQSSVRSVSSSASADTEMLHSKYLDLHKRMKAFWKPFKTQCAEKGNPLKGPVGDMRRELRKAMGQITVKRDDSRAVITKIRAILRVAQNVGGPTVDIRHFIVSQPIPAVSNEADAQYPAILLYAFICFEKFVVKQLEQEAANEEGRIIQELGAIAASLLVDKEFVWKGVSFIDLLLAKYHRACPILFGISGNMNTAEGKVRMGWINIAGESPTVNTYNQRMLGLACGYAALSLRHVAAPAVPMSEYWRAVASICNTPAELLSGGHFMVLKGLVRDFPKKFILYYGAQAIALLRKATVDLPSRAPPHAKDAANLVKVLPDSWKSNLSLNLN